MRTVHFFATYYEQEQEAPTLINSLMRQTADNWKLTICSNADNTLMNVQERYHTDPRIHYTILEENTGFWGAKNRRDFYQSVDLDTMVVMTSVEDYYVPRTVEYINSRGEDFIYWDFTHHHFDYKTTFAISQPRMKKIDWGNFAILSDKAKEVNISELKNRNAEDPQKFDIIDGWEQFMGDGIFVEEVFKKFPEISNVRIPKILFAKN
jgi:hypothetical protein